MDLEFYSYEKVPTAKTTTVYLQSMHITLKKKIRFDASQNVQLCRKQYACHKFIYFLKTKFSLIQSLHIIQLILIHQNLANAAFITLKLNFELMSQHAENSIPAITAYNTEK